MKLHVKNKKDAEAGNDLVEPHIIISINYPSRENPDDDERTSNPATNEHTKEVLFLHFSDVGRLSNPYDEGAKSNPRCVPFNTEIAKQVIDLIERNKVEHIIVHCLMGWSRSASMADAISMYYNDEKTTSWWVQNDLVYGTMLEELVKHEELHGKDARLVF